MAASLGLGVLTACNSAEEVKASEYVNGTNFYYGDGQDVHLQGWITSVTNDAWTVEEGFVDEDAEGLPSLQNSAIPKTTPGAISALRSTGIIPISPISTLRCALKRAALRPARSMST